MMFRRLTQLFLGLALYGFAAAVMVRAGLGLSPWNVFHEGVARHTHLSFGTVVGLTGAVLLLAWVPLRQRIGVGTIANVLVIGAAADLSLALLPTVSGLIPQASLLLAGVVLTGVATGVYIGAGLEPGPRDGLMTGIVRQTGWSVRATRTGIEVAVLATGALLGGKLGIGTLVYALAIGPLAQLFMPLFAWRPPVAATALAPAE